MKVEIDLPQVARRGSIRLDGVDVSGVVRSITVQATVDDVTRVTLELLPEHLIATMADAEVKATVAKLPRLESEAPDSAPKDWPAGWPRL